MEKLTNIIQNNQPFLIKRTLKYAKLYGYTKYTSTLEEAWAASISGLSKAFSDALLSGSGVPEIKADHDFKDDPITAFGMLEAKLHRHRGISLIMFLSLMKYYRQAYLDLLYESVSERGRVQRYLLWTNRFFDNVEIAYIGEWTNQSTDTVTEELRMTNMRLTNEKNKYLTIFESSPNPAFVIDSKHNCINMNYAAIQALQENVQNPGSVYYSTQKEPRLIKDVLPWLDKDYFDFIKSCELEISIEKKFDSPTQGKRTIAVKFHKMLDVSNKFDGTVIIFNDLTDYKIIEEKLKYMSFHDQLTGLHNRAYLEEILIGIVKGERNPVGIISIDIDGLKLVNDNWGHAAGDALLVNASQLLKQSFRKSDIIVRVGGDEFCVVLPLSDAQSVKQACGRVKENTLSYNKTNADLPLSLSIGWAVGNVHDKDSITATIKDADDRMYEKKRTNHTHYVKMFHDQLELQK